MPRETTTGETIRVAPRIQRLLPLKKPIGIPKKPTLTEMKTYASFSKHFVKVAELGKGGDGIVHSYRHPPTGTMVAVKYPHDEISARCILAEIKHFKLIGKHEHIVKILAFSSCFGPSARPAVFMELCDLGDLITYYREWCKEKKDQGLLARIPEVTIWKLLRDMSLALDHLHNNLGMVHGDIKTDNILVLTPKGYAAPGLPEEPIFKLADVARLTPYPTPPKQKDSPWRGTYEYAPPFAEQSGPVKPSADMWSLGAVIQEIVLDIYPVQSEKAFREDRRRQGLELPGPEEELHKLSYWRSLIPVIHRPINAPMEGYTTKYDVPDGVMAADYQPYSSLLNAVYSTLLEKDPLRRATSAFLVKTVPIIEEQLKGQRIVNRAEEELWAALAGR
jgi:serine/threonine protein kinase